MPTYMSLMRSMALINIIGFCATPVIAQINAGNDVITRPARTERIEEVVGKWILTCLPREGQRICAIRQIQVERRTNSRVLMIEMRGSSDGTVKGGAILPHDLNKEAGIHVSLDGKGSGPVLPIRECTPKGCTVTMTFAPPAMEKIRNGVQLQFIATQMDGRTRMFYVDLSGFAQAIDRGLELERVFD